MPSSQLRYGFVNPFSLLLCFSKVTQSCWSYQGDNFTRLFGVNWGKPFCLSLEGISLLKKVTLTHPDIQCCLYIIVVSGTQKGAPMLMPFSIQTSCHKIKSEGHMINSSRSISYV